MVEGVKDKIFCSFCGKSPLETEFIVMAPGNIGICIDCVLVALETIGKEKPDLIRIDIAKIEYRIVKTPPEDSIDV